MSISVLNFFLSLNLTVNSVFHACTFFNSSCKDGQGEASFRTKLVHWKLHKIICTISGYLAKYYPGMKYSINKALNPYYFVGK